jgi:hypothetical protein
VILERSEAYRFGLAPFAAEQWQEHRLSGWSAAVERAARQWSSRVEEGSGAIPDFLASAWQVWREHIGTSLEQLAEGGDWHGSDALLTLHAVADEACGGLGVALDAPNASGLLYRTRCRELLARTGSLARTPSNFVRVLPKERTPPSGTSLRSLSRYACVLGPGVDVEWLKLPCRRFGRGPRTDHVNFLLLPWPLRVRETDFRPFDDSVHRLAKEPYGLFEFAPSEGLDLALVEQIILAAKDEVDSVWVHTGLSPGLAKAEPRRGAATTEWFHVRQNKHHRWSLDERQINQYHLGGALNPRVRWWEAAEVPRRSVAVAEYGEGITVIGVAPNLLDGTQRA